MYRIVRSYGCFVNVASYRGRTDIDAFELSEHDSFFAIL